MPKNTLILITALVFTTIVLFLIAVYALQHPLPLEPKHSAVSPGVSPSPTVTVLPADITFSQDTVNLLPKQTGKIGVILDTHNKPFTGAQLDIVYDKSVISNVSIALSALGETPLFTDNRSSTVAGTLTFAFGVDPKGNPLRGPLQIATITMTAASQSGQVGALNILPSSVVTLQNNQTGMITATQSAVITVGESNQQSVHQSP